MERQQRTVTTADGVGLAVTVRSRPGTVPQAPTVVLAHDWGLNQASWDAVVARLAPSGLHVVTWDQRGHGASTLGVGRAALDSLSAGDLGRDLGAVVRAVVPPASPVILVGHSLGGMACLSYLGESGAGGARGRVVGAVLVSTAAVDVRLGQEVGRVGLGRRLRLAGAGSGEEAPVRAGNLREVLFGEVAEPEAVAAVQAAFKGTDPAVLRAAYRAFCSADVRSGLEPLMRLPVSIMVGGHDRVTPPARSRAMTMTLTQARYVSLRSAGHLLPYEAPDRIIEELRWVVSVVGARLRAAAARGAASQSL